MDESNNLIPDNTIVIFSEHSVSEKTKALIRRPSKKRDWFSADFYRCLPLSIANQYGFEILSPFSFNAIWDGSNSNDGITFTFFDSPENLLNNNLRISTHFGHGIITFDSSWTFRTPKGVNLMTMNPSNHIISNITVMSAVIETDNLQRDFTLNLKIQEPHKLVSIKAGEPITTLLPVQRYFQDNFKLQYAEEILSEEQIIPELQTWSDSHLHRQLEYFEKKKRGVHYMKGVNIYNEPYEDHQGPIIDYET